MDWPSVIIELSVLAFGLAFLFEAWKTSFKDLFTFIGAALFGLGIEFAFVILAEGYSYGDSLISPTIAGHAVPLWVSVGWACIIYTAMKTSDRTRIPWFLRPIFDGFLAVSIDLTLDPVAEHLGFWHWHHGGDYFGVPYDNFIGWMMIVGFYSFSTRAGFRLFGSGTWAKDILIPLGGIATSIGLIAGCEFLLRHLYGMFGQAPVFAVIFGVLLAIITPFLWPARTLQKKKWYQTAIPLYFHSLMIVLLFSTGLYLVYPTLIVLFPAMLIVSLFAFNQPKFGVQ